MSDPLNLPLVVEEDDLLAALNEAEAGLSNPGFCLSCGYEQEGYEPDAQGYECESCGEKAVYGAFEVLLAERYRRRK